MTKDQLWTIFTTKTPSLLTTGISTTQPRPDGIGQLPGRRENAGTGIRTKPETIRTATAIILTTGRAAVGTLQRHMRIGYIQAADLMDDLQATGVIGPADSEGVRQILTTKKPATPELLAGLTARLALLPTNEREQVHILTRRAEHLRERISLAPFKNRDFDRRELKAILWAINELLPNDPNEARHED
jgi:hypothetical protein